METWKDIKGYEGKYQISDQGNVRSKDRYVNGRDNSIRKLKGKPLKKFVLNSGGYEACTLCKNGKMGIKLIHQLVANAFIPNHENKPQINHIDCNKLNNNINNLERCTPSENMQHAIKNVKFNRDYRNKKIYMYDLEGNLLKTFNTIREASIYINGDISKENNISGCILGRQKTACNFKWDRK